MNKIVDDIRRRVQVDTNKDYPPGAMYRDIRVLMEEYDTLKKRYRKFANDVVNNSPDELPAPHTQSEYCLYIAGQFARAILISLDGTDHK